MSHYPDGTTQEMLDRWLYLDCEDDAKSERLADEYEAEIMAAMVPLEKLSAKIQDLVESAGDAMRNGDDIAQTRTHCLRQIYHLVAGEELE